MNKVVDKMLIGVFGAADTQLKKNIARKVRIIGEEIAKSGNILVTGSCGGYPGEAVEGANKFRGEIIGFSPAKNLYEHINKYKLPDNKNVTVIYTNTNFVMRDFLNVSSIEAGIIVNGKIGTLHELCILLESGKIIGVLEKSEGVADLVKLINLKLEKKELGYKIIYDENPRELVKKIEDLIKKKRKKQDEKINR